MKPIIIHTDLIEDKKVVSVAEPWPERTMIQRDLPSNEYMDRKVGDHIEFTFDNGRALYKVVDVDYTTGADICVLIESTFASKREIA